MRHVGAIAAVLVLACTGAAPAYAVTLHPRVFTALTAATSEHKDKVRSCQAGPHKSLPLPGPASAGEQERRGSAVACEFPPRSQPKTGLNEATGGLGLVG
jgi:hypothetical protein